MASRCLIRRVLLLVLLAVAAQGRVSDSQAQTANADANAAPGRSLEEVTVTGTRIVRDGYEAPTPVSVLSADELNNMAQTNVADAINRLPAVSGSTRPQNENAEDINTGINALSLRGLHANRTLVLLDGHRLVASTIQGFNDEGGAVDVNVLPNNLISRVDVVTGGASAVYGSDALAGVVNFVLDKKFTGLKGSVEGGITTYGDDKQYTVSLAAGVPFAGGRGHLLLSGEFADNLGVLHNNRRWNKHSYLVINNPAYAPGSGQPEFIAARDAAMAIASRGGLILDTPLAGTNFSYGGTPLPFAFGASNGFMMIGGDWQLTRIDNDPMPDVPVRRGNAFARASFDITDSVSVWTELMYADARARMESGVPQFQLGSITITPDNAFLAPSLRTEMLAQGIPFFVMGTNNADLPGFIPDNEREMDRYAVGFEGRFDLFNSSWSWDASAGRSLTHISAHIPYDVINANYTNAVDAVFEPGTGKIVCRSTLTDPTNGCIPFNPMGIGVNSPQAAAYVTGTGYANTVLSQNVYQANVRGEPFSSWAGPVSLALGVEDRKETVKGKSSALDQAAAFFAGNYTATTGSFSVKEGFVETVVPLAKNMPFAQALDLNAAARFTDYSTSGNVTTWKIGAVYTPIEDITFRATRSRDIRAPNLGELFNAGRSGTGAVTDPGNGVTSTIISRVIGNPNLDPEKADTTGLGVVLRPSFLSGFTASADYYHIDINGAIKSLGEQEYVDRCFAGDQAACSAIQRDANGIISYIAIQPVNVSSQVAKGLDLEASYRKTLSDLAASLPGTLTLRLLATHVSSLKTIDNGNVVEGAGVVADGAGLSISGLFAPKWKYHFSATYEADAFSGTLTARGIGSGVYNNAVIACASGCPDSTADHPTINTNSIGRITYFDLALNYRMFDEKAEFFFVTENLFNRDPPLIGGPVGSGFYQGQGNYSNYDHLGRIFRAGVRLKL